MHAWIMQILAFMAVFLTVMADDPKNNTPPSSAPSKCPNLALTGGVDGEKFAIKCTGGEFNDLPPASWESMPAEVKRATLVVLSGMVNNASISFEEFDHLNYLELANLQFTSKSKRITVTLGKSELEQFMMMNTNAFDVDLQYRGIPGRSITTLILDASQFQHVPAILYRMEVKKKIELTDITRDMWNESVGITENQKSILVANAEKITSEELKKRFATIPDCATKEAHGVCVGNKPQDSPPNDGGALGTVNPGGQQASGSGTAPANAAPSKKSGGASTLTIVLIPIAVIALVLALVVGRRYMGPKQDTEPSGPCAPLFAKSDENGKLSFISNDEALRNCRLEQHEISLTKSVGVNRLWIGEYQGQKVLVKRIEAEVSDSYVTKQLMAQARDLSAIHHPSIVKMIGVTWLAGTDFSIVCEYMDKGTLKSVLMDADVELNWTTKLQMCLSIARALAYLHENNMYLHRLSSRKVVVNSAMECKLNLLDCFPITDKTWPTESSFGTGDVPWTAPELLVQSSGVDVRKCNVFALGVLLGEILSGESPYQNMIRDVGNTLTDVQIVKQVRSNQPLRPFETSAIYASAPALLRDTIERCLSLQPQNRPMANGVAMRLEGMLNDLQSQEAALL